MKLQANKREILGKKVKVIRSQDLVPGSVYGPSRKSEAIQFNGKEFKKLFERVGYNKFFDLELEENKPVKVLVKEVQTHPVADSLISVNFYQVDENKKINVEVPIELKGDSPAVAQNIGFLVQQLDTVNVHCLPKDLPQSLEVDISTLVDEGQSISVNDLTLPADVELSSDMDATTAVVYIAAPQKEEEPEPEAVAVDAEGNPIEAPAVDADGKSNEGGEAKTEEVKE